MRTIGFLHTADVHVATFRALRADVAPDARDVHTVDQSLLADARASGITVSVRERIAGHLRLLARDADAIVCTCSTIGGEAELLAECVDVPVIRVDRPMAEMAVRAGRRVAVVAALESTLEPTRALLEDCARGLDTEVRLEPCLEAWPLFEAGDLEGYLTLIAEHVRELSPRADVVVLAQASMASVEPVVADLDLRVLSSPRSSVEMAVQLATRARKRPNDDDHLAARPA